MRFATVNLFASRRQVTTACEIIGSSMAIVYSLLFALNIGAEVLAFSMLFVSSFLFGAWAKMDRRWAFLALQLFYAASAIIGILRWS